MCTIVDAGNGEGGAWAEGKHVQCLVLGVVMNHDLHRAAMFFGCTVGGFPITQAYLCLQGQSIPMSREDTV